MNAVHEPTMISVEMEVSSYREYRGEELVEVWGHVGDYEICIVLSKADKRVQRIKQGPPRDGSRARGA
jgi:hypothetical protein